MNIARLALRMLVREWRAGELRVLALAVLIAVAGLASVNAFTARMQLALSQESNRLLGADLVLASDHAPAAGLIAEAQRRGLATAQTALFPSMVSTPQESRLAEIKAVSKGYPLRGSLRIATAAFGADHRADGIPGPGSVWLEARLANELQLAPGASIQVGYSQLKVAAILASEPDRGGDFFNLAPRLLMNQADLPATGLIQPGSRVGYRLLIAGESRVVEAYRNWLAPHLERGQRVLGVRDARPEIRNVLDKAERYLGLAVLLAAMLAAVAILLSARHFLRRHLDACALLRCFGASQRNIAALYALQMAVLGVLAALAGVALGYVGQAVLAGLLGKLAKLVLPPANGLPFLQAALAGLVLLAGFSLPTLFALRRTPALRILRRDGVALDVLGAASYLAGLATLTALLFWQVRDTRLTLMALSGMGATLLVTILLAWLLVLGAGWLGARSLGSWRQGLLNLRRRAGGSVIQVSAFTLGMLALLLLTVVRGDLLNNWRATLPADAPNHFVINIQPDQVVPLQAFFRSHGLAEVSLYPMIRGRLTAINGHAVNPAAYADRQTRRLLEREFNLSYADRLPQDNNLVAGNGWNSASAAPQFSVEQGIAQKLHLKPGGVLRFDVGGTPVSARITSLRKVNWDSFRVNFFVIANSGLLQNIPASYITSFYLPAQRGGMLNEMVKAYPNLTVIDVSAIMKTVQDMLDRVTAAVQFVFIFSLASGLVVLYAALATTRDERALETALWRVLGARRGQLWVAQVTEFAAIGLLAGLLAAAGASAIGWALSSEVFNLPYHFNPVLWLVAMGSGSAGVALAGVGGLWGISRETPLVTLRAAT
ncbi:inner membrane transport permease [Sulfuriferula plumbiphila]|uniref:Inner membrane transport permease n=1 Tax=Sulfuriferula plumbiphila TaxID=171865 RepID=A0A512L8T9_9PROT|nr:FtsX-like permease family protein [Sulfuriferula plumbiphila]BBP04535.1 inner membrane transport permease [Sulfuriferula plumbiphila]GEP30561.1 inner membrane transport permease [Sulfuriferula plumbiphila]